MLGDTHSESSISNLINQVIQKRPSRKDKVDRLLQTLSDLCQSLIEFQSQQYHISAPESQLLNQLERLNTQNLISEYNQQLAALTRLQSRLGRSKIVIGVIGRARQGKSRLLQSLTGLGSEQIPDGDRSHCTGVLSTISHSLNATPYAEVHLHTEHSFLEEKIYPYFEHLPNLGPTPKNLDDFIHQKLPQQDASWLGGLGAKLTHLKQYQKLLPEFRTLLSEPSPRQISIQDTRKWVAQTSIDNTETYVYHHAVRHVEIHCPFPHTDVENISVIDMPGLGDTGIGSEERLLKTVGQEVDAAIFVRMPKPLGDHWADVDVHLYDLTRQAIPELPIYLWTFMVLNRTENHAPQGDNLKNCQDLQNDIKSQRINVSECIIADCSNSVEVSHKILTPVLSHLSQHIGTLDDQYTQQIKQKIASLLLETRTQINNAQTIVKTSLPPSSENPLFRELFEEIWYNISGSLEKYLSHLQNQRNEEDPDLKEHIEEALFACRNDPAIPSSEQIERLRNARGSYSIAYNELLHEVRTNLSRQFLRLDSGLKRSLLSIKQGIVDALCSSGLKNLSNHTNTDYLLDLRNRLPMHTEALIEGFDMLIGFDLSYRGLIQHRIRRHLDGLTPDLTNLHLSSTPSGDEIHEYLQTLHKEALYAAEEALQGLLFEPNQAAFAMVEEFVDRVLRAKGARTQWDILLYESRHDIWPNAFKDLQVKQNQRDKWENTIQNVIAKQLMVEQTLAI